MNQPVAQPMGETPRQVKLPAWFPPWAKELAELYFSGASSLFILHGNVHDLIWQPEGTGSAENAARGTYHSLAEFLATQLFGTWDIVLHHDLGRGLRPLAGSDRKRLQTMVQYLSARLGEVASWPRDAENVLLLLDRFIERHLVEDAADARKSIGMVFEYAQYLTPAGGIESMARGHGSSLVRLLGWAQNPYIRRANIAFCLVADKLSEINDRLVHSPHTATIEIPLPDRAARELFCLGAMAAVGSPAQDAKAALGQLQAGLSAEVAGPAPPGAPSAAGAGSAARATSSEDTRQDAERLSPAQLAELSNGLSLVNLNVIVAQARGNERGVEVARFRQLKKALIERQCQGLVEFVEPKHTLEMVVGQKAARQRLQEDAQLLLRGRLDAAPMGYLLCGAVGTGKTFLAECYAGSIGIPCVELRNFRSKYVGETEGNLERVLTVLRSLGPVVVINDEADAALGTRQAEGDSGTSSRVFAMIANQMGDTSYRGRIVWMLLTSRPDFLPIDLKRQGRAEVHIPLFYPQDEEELRSMFLTMARKNKSPLSPDAVPPVDPKRNLSGSDIESIVLAARRRALAAGRDTLERADLEFALSDFIPSAQGLEKEAQELAAVLECTQLSFLPPLWREKVTQPNGRTVLQERLAAIRQILND